MATHPVRKRKRSQTGEIKSREGRDLVGARNNGMWGRF